MSTSTAVRDLTQAASNAVREKDGRGSLRKSMMPFTRKALTAAAMTALQSGLNAADARTSPCARLARARVDPQAGQEKPVNALNVQGGRNAPRGRRRAATMARIAMAP